MGRSTDPHGFRIVKHALLSIAAIAAIGAHILWTPDANAQTTRRHDVFGRYQQLKWHERDGLPQNTVLALAATRDGYLWMGTYEGAARFDGVRFTVFNPGTTTGIGNSLVTSLLERRDGDLWLGTYGGGVSRLSGGRFTPYSVKEGLPNEYTTYMSRIAQARSGSPPMAAAWPVFGRPLASYTVSHGLPSNRVRAFLDDDDGGLLDRYDEGSRELPTA